MGAFDLIEATGLAVGLPGNGRGVGDCVGVTGLMNPRKITRPPQLKSSLHPMRSVYVCFILR